MSFSCTIKAGRKDLTKYDGGQIHSQLLGLAPNTEGATDAPYRLNDIRYAVANCRYGDRLHQAASDCFAAMQGMLRTNIESLLLPPHCETCTCGQKSTAPIGWDLTEVLAFLAIDPKDITYIHGGW